MNNFLESSETFALTPAELSALLLASFQESSPVPPATGATDPAADVANYVELIKVHKPNEA